MSGQGYAVVCDGEAVYESITEAAAATGVSRSSICKALQGSGTACGHEWSLPGAPRGGDPVARFRCCRYCRRWTPGPPGRPGRCADGYSAAPTDTCARLDMVYRFAVD